MTATMEKVVASKQAEAFEISALPAKTKRNSCAWMRLDWNKLQIAGLCVVIVVVWSLLCLPVVFYHQRTTDVTGSAQCEKYEGSVCAGVFQCNTAGMEPSTQTSTDTRIFPYKGNQRGAEVYITLLTSVFANASGECPVAAAFSLACRILLPRCTSDDDIIFPTYEECIGTVYACRDTLAGLQETDLAELIDCDRYRQTASPDSSIAGLNDSSTASSMASTNGNGNATVPQIDNANPCIGTGTGTSAMASPNATGENKPRQCREDFEFVDGICVARCDSWSQFPDGVRTVVRVFLIFAICAVILGSSLVIILSCLRWKAMLLFPSVFLVFMTLSCLITGFFVMVTLTDQKGLFCHELSVSDAVENPTPFCTITGIVWQYGIISLAAWWLSHVCCIFWKVVFPLHAREHRRHQQYLYVVLTIASLLAPIPSIIAAFLTGGYAVNRFPPLMCGVKDLDVQYYSLWFVINVLWGVGITLLIIMFWRLHRHQGLFRKKSADAKLSISTAEKKLLCVFMYYIFFTAITLIYYGILTRDHAYFIDEVEKYFLCESVGFNPDNPCPKDYEKYTYGELEAAAYLFMGLIPAINLIFVVHIQELKVRLSKLCHHGDKVKHSGSSPSGKDTELTFEREGSVRNARCRSISFSSCTGELISTP